MKGKVLLLSADRRAADELARDLDAHGWACAVCEASAPNAHRIPHHRSVAVIVDLGHVPEHVLPEAVQLRGTYGTVPLIFIGASKVVEQVRAAVPDAIFASRGALDFVLAELTSRQRPPSRS